METIFQDVVKFNPSFYFLMCEDIIYTLEKISLLNKSGYEKDFWLMSEDYINRMKNDLTLVDLITLYKIYFIKHNVGSGTLINFIEKHIIQLSSNFRHINKQNLLSIILFSNLKQRTDTAFTKVLS